MHRDREPKLFRVRPVPPPDAKDDNVLVLINPKVAKDKGIELDKMGFPTPQSLTDWHKENNPQLFKKGK